MGGAVPANKNGNQSAQKKELTKKEYERELRKPQTKLVEMQEWVKAAGARVVVIFEGWDATGKGGSSIASWSA